MSITNGYCSLADLKAVLRIVDSIDDPMLEDRIEEASRAIDLHCDRRFFADSATSARVFVAAAHDQVFVDDIASADGLVVKIDSAGDGSFTTTLTAAQYQAEPLNSIAKAEPLTSIRSIGVALPTTAAPAGVQITARWGWPEIPRTVHSACIILAGRLTKRGDSLLGVAGFGDLGAITVRTIDPDVERMLRPFRRYPVA